MRNKTQSSGALVAEYFQEYLEAITRAREFQVSNLRHWDVIRCYAEFQFRLNGGGKCAICRATVRHVVPVTAVRAGGQQDHYPCLCTRCYEGERAAAVKMIMSVGEAQVEETPREYGTRASDYTHKSVRGRAAS